MDFAKIANGAAVLDRPSFDLVCRLSLGINARVYHHAAPSRLTHMEFILRCSRNQGGLRSIRSIRIVFDMFDRFDIQKTQKFRNATFEGIKPIVPGFFRIGIRFERIPGRSA